MSQKDYTTTMQLLKCLTVETRSLVCMACGCADYCATHGCIVLHNAAEYVDELKRDLAASEAARSDLARQLAAAIKELHEAKSDLDAMLYGRQL